MKFIRHILSHIMLLILLGLVSASYYFRNQLLPDEYVQVIDHYAEKVHPDLVALASNGKLFVLKEANDNAVVIADQKPPAADNKTKETIELPLVKEIEISPIVEEVVAEAKLDAEVSQEESAEVTKEKPVEVVTEEQSVTKESIEEAVSGEGKSKSVANNNGAVLENKSDKNIEQKVVEQEPAEKPEEKQITEVVVKNAKAVQPPVSVAADVNKVNVVTDKESASYKELLNAARMAYATKQYAVSVDKYKALINLEDYEADFYGELGNVYYAMGSWDKASDVYYQAAQLLIKKGDFSQVFYLQRVLQGLNKDKAEKLAQDLKLRGS